MHAVHIPPPYVENMTMPTEIGTTGKGYIHLWDTMQGLSLCVHWRDRESLGETLKWTQDSSKEEWRQEWHRSSCLDEPAPSQLGSCLSQARGKKLLEKKGPRGPSHSPKASDLESGLWAEHQCLLASLARQTSFPLVTPLTPLPLTRTPHPSWLPCTPSDFTFAIQSIHPINYN